MFKEIKILDVSLMTWKEYGGNQCKLVGKRLLQLIVMILIMKIDN
jgi:hypothetical protein